MTKHKEEAVTKKVRPTKVEEEKVTTERTKLDTLSKVKQGWKVGPLFWGLLIVTLGALLLLRSLNVIDINVSESLRLWPLLIIAVGFSVLASTHWIWKILSLVFMFITIIAVVWVGISPHDTNRTSTNQAVQFDVMDRVNKADITFGTGSGTLDITSASMKDIVQAKVEGDNLELEKDNNRNGMTQTVKLLNDNRNWFMGAHESNWDITLNELLLTKLTIEAGASTINANLSNTKLTDLVVKVGASSSTFTIGDKQSKVNITIESGASSTTLRIPKDSGVVMKLDDGLTTREFEDLDEVSAGEYKSKNYDTAKNTITIKASTGVGSFKIERY